jgi:hypothetical protein
MRRNRIQNGRDLARLTARQRDAWERAGDAVATARRHKISLRQAARMEGTTVETVCKYYPGAVTRHGERGWYRASQYDRAYRGEIHLTTADGDVLETVRDSRSRMLVGDHANAVRAYLNGDDPSGAGLRRFRSKRISGRRLLDDRDLALIDRLQQAGELDWQDIYDRSSR